MRHVVFGVAVLCGSLSSISTFGQSTAMQMATQNMNRFGINPSNMRLPMGGGRTFVLNQNYAPGVGFSSGFGVINPRGQSFYSGQSNSFRGGGQSATMGYSRPGFAFSQGWVQGGGLNGSRFGFSNGRTSGGSSFLNNRNTGVMSFGQGFSNGRFASSQGWVQGGGLNGSRFGFSNGRTSGGSSFLNNRNTGVMSLRQEVASAEPFSRSMAVRTGNTAASGGRSASNATMRQGLFGRRQR